MHKEDCLRRIGAHSTRVSAYDKEKEYFSAAQKPARAFTPAEAGQLGQALSQTKRHEAQSLADRE